MIIARSKICVRTPRKRVKKIEKGGEERTERRERLSSSLHYFIVQLIPQIPVFTKQGLSFKLLTCIPSFAHVGSFGAERTRRACYRSCVN